MGRICLTVLLSFTATHSTDTTWPGHNSHKYYTIRAKLLTIHHAANPAALFKSYRHNYPTSELTNRKRPTTQLHGLERSPVVHCGLSARRSQSYDSYQTTEPTTEEDTVADHIVQHLLTATSPSRQHSRPTNSQPGIGKPQPHTKTNFQVRHSLQDLDSYTP
jgi:hypothetical protein